MTKQSLLFGTVCRQKLTIAFMIMLFIIVGCGGGGGDGGDGGDNPVPLISVEGSWNTYHTTVGESGEEGPDVLAISQSGSNLSLTMHFAQGGSYDGSGTITGSSFKASWTDIDGYSVTASGTVSGDTITGTWSDNGGQSGTWHAEKVNNANLQGTWNTYHTTVGESGEKGPDVLAISQSGSNLSFTISFATGGSSNGTGSISGAIFNASWTDTDGYSVTANGTVNGDTITGTWSDNSGQSGTWYAEKSDNQGTGNSNSYTVSGNVYETGTTNPISGVTVSIGNISDTTNTNGSYTLNNVSLGSQTITAQKSGYEGYSATINVNDGNNTYDIYMAASILTGTLSGYVRYPDSNPVQGALVSIGDMQDTTDALGHYQFGSVPQGNIHFIVTHPDADCQNLKYSADIYLSSASKTFNIQLDHCYVSDPQTGLIWSKFTYVFPKSEMFNFCPNLNIEGYSGWRLPSMKELLTIVELGKSPAIDTSLFYSNDMDSNNYASTLSSTHAYNDSSLYWTIYFNNFQMNGFSVVGSGLCRCVRGNVLQNDFVDNGNGTITDNSTGLMWEQNLGSVIMTDSEAKAYCSSLSLGGHSDWRLPTFEELEGIVDYEKYDPAIDTNFFNGFFDQDIRSSTENWYIDFYDGKFIFSGNLGYPICVR